MADLSVQTTSVAGDEVTFAAAAAGGDAFLNTGHEILLVNNGGGSPITVTLDAVAVCNQGTTHDGGGSVPAGQIRSFGNCPTWRFNDANGKVQVTYSGVTSVTVAVIKDNEDGI